jgi:hypothetical protein
MPSIAAEKESVWDFVPGFGRIIQIFTCRRRERAGIRDPAKREASWMPKIRKLIEVLYEPKLKF